jgi:hypothetical protein
MQKQRRQSNNPGGRPRAVQGGDGGEEMRNGDDFIALGRPEERGRKRPVNIGIKSTEFSITIGRPGVDIEPAVKEKLELFVATFCKMAYFGLERGSSREYLHWQGVIITNSPMHAAGVNRKIKECLGWLEQSEGRTHGLRR